MTDEGKRDGMARAARHANPLWWAAACGAVVAAARELDTLTTDDVVERIPARYTTPEMRALGPVMTRAAKDGVIVKAVAMPINCARPSRHSAPLTVWRSLLRR